MALSSDGKTITAVFGETFARQQDLGTLNNTATQLSNKLNNFLEGSDADNIINKWKELEAFLDGLTESDRTTTSGLPELKDYPIWDRILIDFIASLKDLKKNLLLLAHETSIEVTRASGGVYTQFQPDFRNLNAIMGIIPVVGRLIIYNNQESKKSERIIILQPTQTTKAKDQLIGNIKTIGQMDLLPKLQS